MSRRSSVLEYSVNWRVREATPGSEGREEEMHGLRVVVQKSYPPLSKFKVNGVETSVYGGKLKRGVPRRQIAGCSAQRCMKPTN